MKARFWKTDWFLGAVVVASVLSMNQASDLRASLVILLLMVACPFTPVPRLKAWTALLVSENVCRRNRMLRLADQDQGRLLVACDGVAGSHKPMIGRYEVEKELGRGAMGVVYQARDPKTGRVVGVKAVALKIAAEQIGEVKERFFREAETAGRLAHPNIVTLYDAGEERDFCYIAMELLEGTDLVPFTRPDQLLAVEKTVSIVARVADALGYAHRHGVVHGDIKPANIMYHPETDSVKVTDFGIARLTDGSKIHAGMVLGTPSYMSPEQLAGRRMDGRSDLFSLAVSLYQLLCGKLPFEASSMAELMFRIANQPAGDIRALNRAVPEALAQFLERAMSKSSDERFQTGEHFAGALRAAFSNVATVEA